MENRFQTLQMVHTRMAKMELAGNNSMLKRIIILAAIAISLSACAGSSELNITGMPHEPKKGPPEYIAGWKAGCQTGMATYSNLYYRNKYSTSVNPQMMQNARYNKGWELGQSYCSYYSATYLANKEFKQADLRADNTWFTMSGDGFFNYGSMGQFKSEEIKSDQWFTIGGL